MMAIVTKDILIAHLGNRAWRLGNLTYKPKELVNQLRTDTSGNEIMTKQSLDSSEGFFSGNDH